LAKAAEVAARRVLADQLYPFFKALREAIAANQTATYSTRGTTTTTVGSFSLSEFSSVTHTRSLGVEEGNRIKKSIREWAQSL
jgi:hypothetical protein